MPRADLRRDASIISEFVNDPDPGSPRRNPGRNSPTEPNPSTDFQKEYKSRIIPFFSSPTQPEVACSPVQGGGGEDRRQRLHIAGLSSWSLSPSATATLAAWRTVRLETGIYNQDLSMICIFAIARF